MNGKPKAPFFIVLLLVVAGLVYYAAVRGGFVGNNPPGAGPKDVAHKDDKIDPNMLQLPAENKDSPPVTTIKEYSFVPAERLPEVKGTSAYQPLKEETLRFALNVWAGWGPIILANNGFKPEKVW